MASVSISLSEDELPEVRVNEADSSMLFIVVAYGDVTLYLPGYNAECAASTRKFGEVLLAAAAKVSVMVQKREVVGVREASDPGKPAC
jgi:hypothetical protein